MVRIACIALACLLLVATAQADDELEQAKRAGHVGEQSDGYLGRVPGAPVSAQQLVDRINAMRAVRYDEIARQRGITPVAVAALAGMKLVERAPPGHWVRDAEGRWARR